MSIVNYQQLFDTLKENMESIAKDSLHDYERQAKTDGEKALDNMKENLQQWASDIETGAMTMEDLGFLLKEDEELNKMVALKQAGMAAIRIDEFKNSIINMIIGTISGLVKI